MGLMRGCLAGPNRKRDLRKAAPLKIADSEEGGLEPAESHGLGSRIDLIACRDAAPNYGRVGMQPPLEGGGKPVVEGRRKAALAGRRECRWEVEASISIVQVGARGECTVENRVLRSCARDRSLSGADAALIRGSEPVAASPKRVLCSVVARLWKLLRVLPRS